MSWRTDRLPDLVRTLCRHLSAEMKDRLQGALRTYALWAGGHLATQQDMWALFWARGAERYLVPRGRLAFVLPFAALNAPVFAGVRAGRMGETLVDAVLPP